MENKKEINIEFSEKDTIENLNESHINENNTFIMPVEPRYYQLTIEDALNLKIIDLFQDTDTQGQRFLSRADLILIFYLYEQGLTEFLDDYKNYVIEMQNSKGYKVINKPHYYLKSIIG